MHQDFQQSTSVGFGRVNNAPAGRIPAGTVDHRPLPVEDDVPRVGNPESPQRAATPEGHRGCGP